MTDVVDEPGSLDPTAPLEPAGLVEPTGTIVIPCPECGTPSAIHTDQRLATDFCPTCDYPLFWARPSVAPAGVEGRTDDALRRAPGASGTATPATLACPVCNELNLPNAAVCVRCGADMNPPPPPPPPPPPAPQPVIIVQPPPPPEPCGHPRTWVVVLVTALVVVPLTLLVVWLV